MKAALWRRIRAVVILFGVMTAVLVVAVFFVRWKHERMWRAELDWLREAGLPASVADLEALYPPIPEELNGAAWILAAIDSMRSAKISLEDTKSFDRVIDRADPRLPYVAEDIVTLRVEVMANDETLVLLEYASAFPRARYDLNFGDSTGIAGTGLDSHGLVQLSGVARAAMIVAAYDGDGARFVDTVRAAFAIPRSLEDVPLRAYETRAVIERSYLHEFGRALASCDFREEELRDLEEILTRIPRHTASRARYGAEIYGLLRLAEQADFSARARRTATGRFVDTHPWASGLPWARSSVSGAIGYAQEVLNTDKGAVGRKAAYWRASLDALDMSFDEGHEALWDLERGEQSGNWAVRQYVDLEGISSPVRRAYLFDNQDRIAVVIARLQIERYRLRRYAWPERLEDLVPEFAAAVPADPYDGSPLVYRRVMEGFRLYSNGRTRTGYNDSGNHINEVNFDLNAHYGAERDGQ